MHRRRRLVLRRRDHLKSGSRTPGQRPEPATSIAANAWVDPRAEIDEEVENLNREKEEAVANQDFEKAASLRDSADKVSFHTVLRNILRSDPDVIMIGEIRDSETAEIAVEAAQAPKDEQPATPREHPLA